MPGVRVGLRREIFNKKLLYEILFFSFFSLGLFMGCNTNDSANKVYLVFENADGIVKGSEVKTRGIKIGEVSNVEVLGSSKVIVELIIYEKHKIPKKSKFTLVSSDILGNKGIEVNFSDFKEFCANDTIEGEKETSIKEAVNSLLSNVQAQAPSTLPESEDWIYDTIISLKEVKDESLYVEQHSMGKRQISVIVVQTPSPTDPYYWVKVGEDNGTNLVTYFNFYVYSTPKKIMFYDAKNDSLLDLSSWRNKK